MNNEILIAEAMDFLRSFGIRPYRTSPYQIKFGPINYWPCRGTIAVDGAPKGRSRGLRALGDFAQAYMHDADPATFRALLARGDR